MLPAASTANTEKVWLPSAAALRSGANGELQAVGGDQSSEQRAVAPVSIVKAHVGWALCPSGGGSNVNTG